MRDSYVPLFQDTLTSSIWVADLEVRIAWFFFLLKADEEGFVSGTAPGLAQQANISLDGMRRAIAAFEAPDPDSRTPDHDGRRLERVARGWRVLNLVAARKRAQLEAERSRKRRWAQESRARGDYEPPELEESQRGAGVGRGPDPATSASSREDAFAGAPAVEEPLSLFAPSIEAAKPEPLPPAPDRNPPETDVSTLRSAPVDARKRKRTLPPPPPSNSKREEAEEERHYDLDGFEPSPGLVAWFERYGLPPMALHERLRKVRLAKVAIGGKNGVGDREEWCRLQAPRWKKWWQDDGGRAEPLPVHRRPQPSLPTPGSGTPMPEALLAYVATGRLPSKAEVAA